MVAVEQRAEERTEPKAFFPEMRVADDSAIPRVEVLTRVKYNAQAKGQRTRVPFSSLIAPAVEISENHESKSDSQEIVTTSTGTVIGGRHPPRRYRHDTPAAGYSGPFPAAGRRPVR